MNNDQWSMGKVQTRSPSWGAGFSFDEPVLQSRALCLDTDEH
jgi:hypothetical protein